MNWLQMTMFLILFHLNFEIAKNLVSNRIFGKIFIDGLTIHGV